MKRRLLVSMGAAALGLAACVGEPVADGRLEAALAAAEQVDPADLEGLEVQVERVRALAAAPDADPELAARVARLEARRVAARAAQPQPERLPQAVRVETGAETITGLAPGLNATLAAACLGRNEFRDDYGAAVAVGDFDGDGIADLAVGAPGEDRFLKENVGFVYVYRGTPNGLVSWHTLTQSLGSEEIDDHFGAVLAAGDIDRDGKDDLVVGVPGEDVGAAPTVDAGWVFTFRGRVNGLIPWQSIGQTLGSNETDDHFGASLAIGDFDADGKNDLAVGAPGEDTLGATDCGFVWIYRGGAEQLTAAYGLHHQALRFIVDKEALGHRRLVTGDFNGDGRADLAARAVDAEGAELYVFLASAAAQSQLEPTQRLVSTNHPGRFATGYAAGDFDNDGHDDLATVAQLTATFMGTTGYIEVFRFDGSTMVSAREQAITGVSARSVMIAANLDTDAFVDDLVITGDDDGSGQPKSNQYRGSPAQFVKVHRLAAGGTTFALAAAGAGDFDDDGFPDIVVNSMGSGEYPGVLLYVDGRPSASPLQFAMSQEPQGCTPIWASAPKIELVSRVGVKLTVKITGASGTTHLRWQGPLHPIFQPPFAGVETTVTFDGIGVNEEACVKAERLTPQNGDWSVTAERCFPPQ